jgi:SAM-dependent methyltransferase
MSFGSVLHRNRSQWIHPIESLIYRVFGWPNILRRLQWPDVFSLLAVNVNMVVLDLGAGSMQYSAELAKQTGAHVVAVDLQIPEGCARWASNNGVSAIKSDATKLPFADHSMDRVMMSSLLQAVPDPALLLKECHRVLKGDGFLVLSVPNHYIFIPRVFDHFAGVLLQKVLGLPRSYSELISTLNDRFHVGGPRGYYSLSELSALMGSTRFRVASHRYAPGNLGTFFWEIGVLLYLRFGPVPIYLLFFFYPLARLCDLLRPPVDGCEHIVKAVPV